MLLVALFVLKKHVICKICVEAGKSQGVCAKSTATNIIIFCDQCNSGFHQLCAKLKQVPEPDEELFDLLETRRLGAQQMGHAVRRGQRKLTHLHNQVFQSVLLKQPTYVIVQDEDQVIVNMGVRETAVLVAIRDVVLPRSDNDKKNNNDNKNNNKNDDNKNSDNMVMMIMT